MRYNDYHNYDNYSDERDLERGEEMSYASSHCSRFSRRRDVSMFNMMDYQSCENCRHLTADDQCILKQQDHFSSR